MGPESSTSTDGAGWGRTIDWLRSDASAASPPEKDRRRQASGGQAAGEGEPPPPIAMPGGRGTGQAVGDAPPQFGRDLVRPQGRQFRFERVVCLVHGIDSSANCSRSLARA